jgi:putative Holliday junction resolvase
MRDPSDQNAESQHEQIKPSAASPAKAPGRYVFIDYGRARVGVAISDPSGRIALPSHTIELKKHRGMTPVEATKGSLKHLQIGRLIVGLPLELSGREGPMAQEARAFGKALGEALGLSVEFYDERMTSKLADQSLRAFGMKRRDRDSHSDEVAACQMLQEILERDALPIPSPLPPPAAPIEP